MSAYQTGTAADFATRLHEILLSGQDMINTLPSFKIESGNYTGAPQPLINQWAREINKKYFIFSGIPSHNG